MDGYLSGKIRQSNKINQQGQAEPEASPRQQTNQSQVPLCFRSDGRIHDAIAENCRGPGNAQRAIGSNPGRACSNSFVTYPLIDARTLRSSLAETLIYDLRWKLGDEAHGRSAYLQGHIPGAVFVDLDRDLSGSPGLKGRHPLPDPDEFRLTLGRLGISPGSRVVVYDDVAGMVAARMWWMLDSIGHETVQVLDGGIQGWTEAGYDLEVGEVEPLPSGYPGPLTFSGVVDIDQLRGRKLIDVRAEERYRGDVEPVDPRPGHVPGAINIPARRSLYGLRFANPGYLKEVFGHVADPVLSCGSGVNACHSALAMATAGMPKPEIFIGSYSEWARSDRPVATGDEPG